MQGRASQLESTAVLVPMRPPKRPRSVSWVTSWEYRPSTAGTVTYLPSIDTTPKGKSKSTESDLLRYAERVAQCKIGRMDSGSTVESASCNVVSGTAR